MPDENKENQNTSLQANITGKVSDVLGVGKGIEKLIDVLSRGVGAISRPFLIRRDADAKAYELRKLAEAIGDNQKLLQSVQYESGGLTMSAQGQPQALPPATTLEERTLARVVYQDAKKQLSVESVVQHAAEELQSKESVSDEKVDDDWVARFFDIAEHVNSEQMRALWGKILAGEIEKPGSYSLRTLDVIRNTTQEEAETFVKVSQAVVRFAGDAFILLVHNVNEFYGTEFGFRFKDIHRLSEAGLMSEVVLTRTMQFSRDVRESALLYGSEVVLLEAEVVPAEFKFHLYALTSAGLQLLSLVEIKPNIRLIEQLASLVPKTVKVYHGDISKIEGDQLYYRELTEIEKTA